MHIVQTLSFKKSIKKFHPNQKKELDKAVKEIVENPLLGEQKKGDLSEVRVYKIKILKTLTLLAYMWEKDREIITLLKISSHENFYRDLKTISP